MEREITKMVRVYGIVQGVGFRPTVSRHAMARGIRGSVSNKGPYVEIYAQGTKEQIEGFLNSLKEHPPKRAAVLKINTENITADTTEQFEQFDIIESEKTKGEIFISPDIAICDECKAEMFDPKDRRYLHPFINCTCCGPRLTILDALPYDRERTSMKEFPMCPDCAKEYTDEKTRRYDAQPVCCNQCGPQVYLIGRPERGRAAITYTRRLIREGKIVAIKGIGGFHLCCDATNEEVVCRLRTLKNRPAKPFAVMAKDESDFYGIGCYDDRDEDIATFASKFMSKNGFSIDNATFQLLCSRLSNDRKISANELDKLITYMGNKKNIDISDIQTVISDTSASSQEDLCYFVAQGFTEKAVASYNRLVFEGEQPVSLIRTLSYHFMKLLDCAVKMEKGETADKVVFGMRPPLMFFRKNAFLSQLRIWNRMRIMNALALLYQTERECKTTDFPAEQAASFTIMRIANGVKRFR